jgi:hypothetical protein
MNTSPQSYRCAECGSSFDSQLGLNVHVSQVHQPVSTVAIKAASADIQQEIAALKAEFDARLGAIQTALVALDVASSNLRS